MLRSAQLDLGAHAGRGPHPQHLVDRRDDRRHRIRRASAIGLDVLIELLEDQMFPATRRAGRKDGRAGLRIRRKFQPRAAPATPARPHRPPRDIGPSHPRLPAIHVRNRPTKNFRSRFVPLRFREPRGSPRVVRLSPAAESAADSDEPASTAALPSCVCRAVWHNLWGLSSGADPSTGRATPSIPISWIDSRRVPRHALCSFLFSRSWPPGGSMGDAPPIRTK